MQKKPGDLEHWKLELANLIKVYDAMAMASRSKQDAYYERIGGLAFCIGVQEDKTENQIITEFRNA